MRGIFHSEMCNEKWLSHSLSCQILMGLYLQESHIQKPSPRLVYVLVYSAVDATKANSALCELVWILEEHHIKAKTCQAHSTLPHPFQTARGVPCT